MSSSSVSRATFRALLAGLVVLAPTAQAADKLAIKVGRIVSASGPDIANGVIVIENGKIQAIGADATAPWDAETLDHPELVAFPGFVEAHTFRGMDRPNEGVEIVPFLDVRDSIDPVSVYFEDSLRQGVTTINIQQGNATVIGGQGMIVKPFGITIEQMVVRSQSGLKLCAGPRAGRSRATQAQSLRRAFTELRFYLEKLVQDKKAGKDHARREALFQGRDLEKEENKKGRAMEGSAAWKVAGLEVIPRGEIDEKQEPLLRLVEGKIPAFFYCDSASSVHVALEVARTNGFLASTVLVLDGDTWKAADVIAEAGVPVILGANLMHVERDPITGDEIETFVPGVFQKKNVRFALQSLNPTSQSLWYQAALCVGYGLDRKVALESVTRVPADILRLGNRVGSLEVGKDGNVLLLSGDPLAVTTTVQYVIIEGKLAYDRSKDVRARHLIDGVEQENTAPSGADANADVHDDEHGDKSEVEKPKVDRGEKDSKKDTDDKDKKE
ncbi:MAG: hypothetical protein ACKVWV_01710 [Planctomycetota bacterium]